MKFAEQIARVVAIRPTPEGRSESPSGSVAGKPLRGYVDLPLATIVCNLQVRQEFDQEAIDRLADSIRNHGQLAPIRVRPDPDSDRYIVLVGERRFRACQKLGLEHVRAQVVDGLLTPEQIRAEQVIENVVRQDLAPVEQGRAFRDLMTAYGWTARDLAADLGVEESAVCRALALVKLVPDVAEQVDAGKIKATAAYEISKLQNSDDQREIAGRVVKEGLDHQETVKVVRDRRQGKGRARPRRLEQRHRMSNGIRVHLQMAARHDDRDIVAALEELAGRLRPSAADVA